MRPLVDLVNRSLLTANQSWSTMGIMSRVNYSAAMLERVRQIETLRSTYAWLIPCMWAILSLAVIGNGLILCSAKWLRSPITPNLRLCVSLAAADLWAAGLMMSGTSFTPSPILKLESTSGLLEIFYILLTNTQKHVSKSKNRIVITPTPP
jgi:hypothetical protein